MIFCLLEVEQHNNQQQQQQQQTLACGGRYYRTVQEVQGATQTTSTVRCYGLTVGGLTAGHQSHAVVEYTRMYRIRYGTTDVQLLGCSSR